MDNIVVLGGTGFVGSQLVQRLSTRGDRVTVLSRNRERHRGLAVLPHLRLRSVDAYHRAALTEALRTAQASVVVNLVGILNEAGHDGRGFHRAHVELTETVIAAMRDAGVDRLLQMSSLRAGEGESHYLKSRGEAEAIVRASDRAWTIMRPSVIFGPGDGLFHRFATLLKLAPVMPLARANARFAPVYVGDVVEAFVRALDDPATIRETYELYGDRVMTLREIVAMTRDVLGLRRPIIALPDALGALQAAVLGFVPGKPMSLDNFRSLKLDSVGTRDGLARLRITPTPVDRIVPGMLRGDADAHQHALDRFRRAR